MMARITRTLRIGFAAGLAVGVAIRIRRALDLRRQASAPVSNEPWTPIVPPPVEPGPTWVAPVDGECPTSHPVKAKVASGLFHLPGMLAYDRTHPDRCYRSEADASADGFTRAKR
jgi:hypothetical protein